MRSRMTTNKVHDMQAKAYHDIPGTPLSDGLKKITQVSQEGTYHVGLMSAKIFPKLVMEYS